MSNVIVDQDVYSICFLSLNQVCFFNISDVILSSAFLALYMLKVIEKQRTGTGAFKRQIPLLKPKRSYPAVSFIQLFNGPVSLRY